MQEVKRAMSDRDELYAALVSRLEAVGDDDALGFSFRLILILMNEVGDDQRVAAAIEKAASAAIS